MILFVLAFVFGLVGGSFLNVCIVRLPQHQSVILPRSHCPQCGAPIRAYDNIPVLSYLILRGRCRACQASISLVYPGVEILTAVVFVLTVQQWGVTPEALKTLLFACALIVLIFTDIKFRLLPNEITVGGMIGGLILSVFVPLRDHSTVLLVYLFSTVFPSAQMWLSWADSSFLNSLLGTVFGFGVLYGVGEIYYLIRRVEGMGMGDVKMMGLVGAFLGLKLTFMTILFGSLLGSLVGLIGILWQGRDMKYELPFGTFLGTAALIVALYGEPLARLVFP